MVLIGRVERVEPGRLVVRDRQTERRVIVHARNTRCYFPGDLLHILYSGVMTHSNPPQISAIAIRRLFPSRSC